MQQSLSYHVTSAPPFLRTVPADWLVFETQGEVGQSKLSPFDKLENAIKDFEKKFKDKTKNSWSNRSDFVSHTGKYTMIEVDGEQDAEVKVGLYLN